MMKLLKQICFKNKTYIKNIIKIIICFLFIILNQSCISFSKRTDIQKIEYDGYTIEVYRIDHGILASPSTIISLYYGTGYVKKATMTDLLIAENELIKVNIIPSNGIISRYEGYRKDIIEIIHFDNLREIALQVIEVRNFKIIYRQINSIDEFYSM